MANYGTYATLSDLRGALNYGAADTADDVTLRRVLESVSRFIDDHCGRFFQPRTETRYYTAQNHDALTVDDLLSVTTLKTDSDGDRVYDETWTATDYDLEPYNEWPKWTLRTAPDGDYTFSGYARGVEIVGLWGFGDGDSATPYTTTSATVTVATTTGTTVTLATATELRPLQTILTGTEQMYITAISGASATVVRGVNGTTAAVQAAAVANIYRYPGPVVEAALLQASRVYRRRDAPFGVTGANDMGISTVITRLDPDVRFMLAPYRKLAVG